MEYFVKPWAHQLDAIEKSKSLRDMALFWEMGTGKTATAINIIRHQYQRYGYMMKTLILSPVVTLDNWRDEWARHSELPPNNVVVLKGTGSQKAKTLFDTIGEAKIVIANYEVLTNQNILYGLFQFAPEIVVFDESQRIKSHKSKRAKAAAQIAAKARHRYILSGTPVLNTPADIFQQFLALDLGETFGSNFYKFQAHYFEDKNANMSRLKYFPKWEPKSGAVKAIADAISKKALRATKDEFLDLPPLIFEDILVEMSPEQKRAYKSMKDEFIAYLGDMGEKPRAIVATLAMTKGLKLQQILSGFAVTDDGTNYRFKENPRAEALKELLEDLCVGGQNKVIVWAAFKENYSIIAEVCNELKIKYAEIHGAITDKDDQIKRFRQDRSIPVLIANQKSAGIGINLIEAAYSIYYSKTFSLEDDIQSEARNYRGGSEMHRKITRIDLVSKGTIDEKVNQALKKKQSIADQILDWKL
jgi:SNF2 family DNA or RNA helicase